jgi:hypothetical protein
MPGGVMVRQVGNLRIDQTHEVISAFLTQQQIWVKEVKR